MSQSTDKSQSLKTIDLFAGVGGIRLGFEQAGFTTAFANDVEPKCKTTYDLNFTEPKLLIEDIRKIKPTDIPDASILLGGFPCQAFSIAGKQQGFEDDQGRGNLFFYIHEILKVKRPKVVLLENVKNLVSHDKGNTFAVIKEMLQQLGYHLRYEVLNSYDHGGVIQNRDRIFIVGFLDKAKADAFRFPTPLQSVKQSVLEPVVDDKYYYKSSSAIYPKLVDVVTQQGIFYQYRRYYTRENKTGLCPTLTANMGTGGHNVPIVLDSKGIRKLTPRECFRLQGFPDTFKLPDISNSALYKQAGNSVTVSVIKRVAEEISRIIT